MLLRVSPLSFNFRFMRGRSFALALLLYQAFFLNVVLPGHTRGLITLDHGGSSDACAACCASKSAKKSEVPTSPSPRDQANCAICHFAMRVTPAPAISLDLPKLGLLAVLPFPAPHTVESRAVVHTYLGRAPPDRA